jgi:hypothetical protein
MPSHSKHHKVGAALVNVYCPVMTGNAIGGARRVRVLQPAPPLLAARGCCLNMKGPVSHKWGLVYRLIKQGHATTPHPGGQRGQDQALAGTNRASQEGPSQRSPSHQPARVQGNQVAAQPQQAPSCCLWAHACSQGSNTLLRLQRTKPNRWLQNPDACPPTNTALLGMWTQTQGPS